MTLTEENIYIRYILLQQTHLKKQTFRPDTSPIHSQPTCRLSHSTFADIIIRLIKGTLKIYKKKYNKLPQK